METLSFPHAFPCGPYPQLSSFFFFTNPNAVLEPSPFTYFARETFFPFFLKLEMDSLSNGTATTATATPAAPTVPAPAPPSSRLGHLGESLKLEHQFLRVPFEHYKKTIRANHRVVEKEVSAMICGVSDAADSDVSNDDAVHHLSSLVSRLQGLKRKVRIRIPSFSLWLVSESLEM
jgi:hypothetical protein